MALSQLDLKRRIAEIHRIRAAKFEMDFRIAEREDEISRLREQMTAQDTQLAKIKDELTVAGIDSSNL